LKRKKRKKKKADSVYIQPCKREVECVLGTHSGESEAISRLRRKKKARPTLYSVILEKGIVLYLKLCIGTAFFDSICHMSEHKGSFGKKPFNMRIFLQLHFTSPELRTTKHEYE
jgi:hypothetical protein